LAVIDFGCGFFILVFLLTLAGWIPGIIGALIIITTTRKETVFVSSDGSSSNVAPYARVIPLSSARWEKLWPGIPVKGPYEPEATDKQRNYLWMLGLRDLQTLQNLGIGQASWLISSAKQAGRFTNLAAIAGMAGLVIALVCFVIFGLSTFSVPTSKRSKEIKPSVLPLTKPRASLPLNPPTLPTPPAQESPAVPLPRLPTPPDPPKPVQEEMPKPDAAPVADMISLESVDGRMIKAKVLTLTLKTVLIRREDGQTFELPLDRLTAESKRRIFEYREAKRGQGK